MILVKFDAFQFKVRLLFLIAIGFWQTDPSLGIDHPVPGEVMLAALSVENADNLPGTVGAAGQQTDQPIGAYFTFRDILYDLNH